MRFTASGEITPVEIHGPTNLGVLHGLRSFLIRFALSRVDDYEKLVEIYPERHGRACWRPIIFDADVHSQARRPTQWWLSPASASLSSAWLTVWGSSTLLLEIGADGLCHTLHTTMSRIHRHSSGSLAARRIYASALSSPHAKPEFGSCFASSCES